MKPRSTDLTGAPPGRKTPARLRRAWLASMLCLLGSAPPAAERQELLYEFAATPQWVEELAPAYHASGSTGISDGAAVLLLDRQVNVTAGGDEHYQHFAVKLLNTVGVDRYSQIGFSVDPSFQALLIHAVRVVRDGQIIDQRERARITTVPQESDLRNRIYNGRYNVDMLLSDVRAGDVVEYAYTVSSRERLFPGHFSAKLYTGWSSPVLRQRIRVRAPTERQLRYRLSDSETAPVPQVRGKSRELVLEWDNVAPVPGDPERPGWYDPWPYLEISDLGSWSEVTRLVSPLFAPPEAPSRRVSDVVEEIRAGGGTPEELALRALRFVQEQISYASIAIGRGTHEPVAPDTVLERRFGDCKDKSLLLVTLLARLGIEAETALVHTSSGRALDEALPTPYAFDHAIVRARIGGEEYWLDATAAPRYSPLAPQDPADFERALLVHAASAELHAIPRPAPDTRQRELRMEFDLQRGIDQPASLVMTTLYRGGLADTMRQVLAWGSPEQRAVDYANYIASYYPGAQPAGPITIEDDKSANVIEVREHYTLPRPFAPDESGTLEFMLHADELYRFGEPLESSVREAPLELEYPIQSRQSLVVRLPEEWPIHEESVTVENPAFRYSGAVGYSAQTLTLDYRYQALADHVAAADLARYKDDRRRFYDDTGYLLTYNTGSAPAGVAPVPAAVLLLTLGGSLWLAVRRGWQYDPEPAPAPPGAPAGIRGWLLLPAIGIVFSSLVFAWLLVSYLPSFTADAWQALPSAFTEPWRGTARPGFLAIAASSIALLAFSTLAAALLFRKRSSFPAVFIAFSVTALLWAIVLQAWLLLSGLDTEGTWPGLIASSIRESLVTLLWVVYLRRSKRVRATFVNRARPRAPAIGSEPLPAG